LGSNSIVSRLFKFFYIKRPLLSRYVIYWPVAQVLNFLAEWHPIADLTLKQLTLKTVALIALASSDRGQTLHLMNIEHTALTDRGITFIIFDRLKHSRKSVKPKLVECINSEIPSLNVADYVTAYMNRTLPIRIQHVQKGLPKPTQLFMSWATKNPVSKQTIARWLVSVLSQAGIDTKQFKAHSYRGAGLSAALNKGAQVHQIVAAGDWSNTETFKKFYSAPAENSNIGQIILNHCSRA